MGDVILTTALLRQIKNKYPVVNIDFLVSSQFAPIIQFNPYIRKVLHYDKSVSAFNINYHNNKFFLGSGLEFYDVVIDLQNNLRTRIFRKGLGKTVLKMFKNRCNKIRLVYFKHNNQLSFLPIPEMYRNVLKPLNIYDDSKGLEFWLPEEIGLSVYPPENRKQSLFFHTDKNEQPLKIAIAPGARHFTKRWLPERFSELIDRLASRFNAEFILLGDTADKEICSFIKRNANAKIKNHAGLTSIVETARLLDGCELLITNDSGVMHIGAARRIPTVAIFGSTVTNFGFIPYRTDNIIVEKNLKCRPCTHIGRASCPQKHFNCMKLITTEDVESACLKLFQTIITLHN
jgi:heptosyltransferase-2